MDVFDPAYICNSTIRVKLAVTPTYKVRQFFYKLTSFLASIKHDVDSHYWLNLKAIQYMPSVTVLSSVRCLLLILLFMWGCTSTRQRQYQHNHGWTFKLWSWTLNIEPPHPLQAWVSQVEKPKCTITELDKRTQEMTAVAYITGSGTGSTHDANVRKNPINLLSFQHAR